MTRSELVGNKDVNILAESVYETQSCFLASQKSGKSHFAWQWIVPDFGSFSLGNLNLK